MELDDYLAAHSSPEPAHLHELYRRTHLRHLYPRMCSGHVQGRLLKMLTAMCAPYRILELGTFTGYSTLCFAEGMPAGCSIDTVEIDDEMADELLDTFGASPWADRIHLHIGDALQVVPALTGEWDLVFIDANKRLYRRYLDLVLPRVPVGGFILADNTLWDGHILSAETCRDTQSRAISEFNDYVARHPQLEVVMLPVRDGLTLMRRVS
ncbi:MAG: O-methyltransferase [Muribaculaceae bacterium]|nr:O-methyltransferase [Muribaculaceae bacterium]